MLFLLNNPILLVSIIFALGCMGFIGKKIFQEIKFNKMLSLKHGSMRIGFKNTGFGKRIGVLGSVALAPALVIALVITIGSTATVHPTGDLLTVNGASDIIDIYESFSERNTSYSRYTWFGATEESIDSNADTAGFSDSLSQDIITENYGSDDYSNTNNQVIGVDEMDNVITDGKYIYSISNNKVLITLAYTQSQGAEVLSNYKELEYVNEESDCPSGFYVTGLYVDDDYLVVIGSEYEYACPVDYEYFDRIDGYYDNWYGYNDNVKVFVYDKTDDFSLESEYDLSGNLIGTRKIDDDLYIVTNSYIPFGSEDLDLDEELPFYTVGNTTVQAKYEDIVYVEGISPNSFTTFFALDLDHEQVDMEVVLGDSGYNLYVSENNIYLVGSIYYFTPLASILDIEEPVSETKTAILKVSISNSDLEYETTGVVSGYTLNQFSMDEYNGHLRIATTTGWWGSDIVNRLFILDEDLNQISVLEGIGHEGETIKSVRFTGDYGYIVTFEQTDPFYIINLTDPETPFKEGELLIPGFSSYLQPLNDNYMLGIGFGDNSGGTNGLKVSIYDISEKTTPTVFTEYIFDYTEFGWGYSSATYNHKDLLVSLSKGIIALPFSTYRTTIQGSIFESGILVLDFDEIEGLSKSGFVRHEIGEEEVYVKKSKFIDNYFYTISNKYIKVTTIDDLETPIGQVTLPQ